MKNSDVEKLAEGFFFLGRASFQVAIGRPDGLYLGIRNEITKLISEGYLSKRFPGLYQLIKTYDCYVGDYIKKDPTQNA